ncbi:MAG TPA: preprotein translocase subunit SecE [Candidatus Aminicenantes bacterium]|nr:preprotein translocase subunit SecE [Candidatus Aminicenantes bacterium]HPB56701.1 preprotein translocase subunit SecE [Candidatus Aminicenantes bacterium]HPT00735.1 preprotein translocase subunit SecE [Candidatus Aminicenantes bacterium]
MLTKIKTFLSDVRSEVKKVTWPSLKEVQGTTILVVIAVVFFGFYLWILDFAFGWLVQNVKTIFR